MHAFYTNVDRMGDYILYRGFDERGKRIMDRVKFKPTIYASSRKPTNTGYRGFITGEVIEPLSFESMRECKNFLESNAGVSGMNFYGNSSHLAAFIQEKFPKAVEFDPTKINIFSFDIEYDNTTGYSPPREASKEITAISMKFSGSEEVLALGLFDYDPQKTVSGIDPKNINYTKCESEKEFLLRFINIWKGNFPDVVTGWNVRFFDITYTFNRILKVLGESYLKMLSPWGFVETKEVQEYGKSQQTYLIKGVSVIDFMDAFKKFGYSYGTQPSYKLDHIAQVVLGEKKIAYEGTLADLLRDNPQLYIDYNIKDSVLVDRMEKVSGILGIVMSVAYRGGVNYNDAFGTTFIWETILYRNLMQKKIVPSYGKSDGEREGLVGGFVKDPIAGLHKWVVSFDLNSLYPHLMMQYNMSPETYIPDMLLPVSQELILSKGWKNTNTKVSVAANGVCFTNEKEGVVPSIIRSYYAERDLTKKKMLETESKIQTETDPELLQTLKVERTKLNNNQMSIKILMNSLYGAFGNRYFKYYVNAIASAITHSGQLSIKWSADTVNGYLNNLMKTKGIDYVLYIDTDSIYVNFGPLMEKLFGNPSRKKGEDVLNAFCKDKMEVVISNGYEELTGIMGAFKNAMKMKREKISDKTIFVSKKRYIMNTLNSEGVHYEIPKISMTGIEAVRSSTPMACRSKIKEALDVIMNRDEIALQDLVAKFKETFYQLPPEEIAKNSGTDDIESYREGKGFKSGCPIHVRGALLYNDSVKSLGMGDTLETIKPGDKVKFLYLKTPNPIRQNVIAFPGVLPIQLGLHKYVDYETQFDKVFLSPLVGILDAIGWQPEQKSTLESLFG